MLFLFSFLLRNVLNGIRLHLLQLDNGFLRLVLGVENLFLIVLYRLDGGVEGKFRGCPQLTQLIQSYCDILFFYLAIL